MGEYFKSGQFSKSAMAISAIKYYRAKSEDSGQRIEKALELIERYGSIDGDHHKAWVLDQVVRTLTGPDYEAWLDSYCEDGQYEWDEGIAP